MLRAVCLPETREVHIFNIVKRRDFMLGHDVPTKQEAEKLRDQYGGEYVVVQSLEEDQHLALLWQIYWIDRRNGIPESGFQ
jgi:hypothetical protein